MNRVPWIIVLMQAAALIYMSFVLRSVSERLSAERQELERDRVELIQRWLKVEHTRPLHETPRTGF